MKFEIQERYRNLPYEEKVKIRDRFIEMLEENDFSVHKVDGLNVKSFIKPCHERLSFLSEDQRNAIGFPDNLHPKLKRRVEVLEKKITQKLWAKAIGSYVLEAMG